MFIALQKKLIFIILVLILFIVGGTIGFYFIENMNVVDAIWYTIMTLTTVGYQVPPEITEEGKWLTIFLMLFGVGFALYALTTLALEFVDGELRNQINQNKIKRKVNKLHNHIILCGFGRNGRQAARKLVQHKTPYIVIDKRDLENRKDEFESAIFIKGDATEDETLKRASIETAMGVIAALPTDAENLFIVISAKGLNKNLKIISRASNSNSISKLKIAGADNVIMPDKIGGEHMASLLITPDLSEFIDNIALEGTENINLLEIATNDLDKIFIGKKLIDLNIRETTGCSCIGYKVSKEEYIINPNDDTLIEENNFIIILGQPEQITNAKKHFTPTLS